MTLKWVGFVLSAHSAQFGRVGNRQYGDTCSGFGVVAELKKERR